MNTVCFIDLDGTLMVNPFGSAVWPIVTRELAAATGLSPKVILNALDAENSRRQKEYPNDPLTMDWDDIVGCVAYKYGVHWSLSLVDLVRDHCHFPHITILDNAVENLMPLRIPNRRLVVASKGLSKYQNPVMQALGLWELFDDFLMPDITGYLKTEVEFFSRYTAQAEDTCFIHVGDHYYDDVICPKIFGFYSVMRFPLKELEGIDPFARRNCIEQHRARISTYPTIPTDIVPDAVIIHLHELPDVVARIEQRATTRHQLP